MKRIFVIYLTIGSAGVVICVVAVCLVWQFWFKKYPDGLNSIPKDSNGQKRISLHSQCEANAVLSEETLTICSPSLTYLEYGKLYNKVDDDNVVEEYNWKTVSLVGTNHL
jgi:hypothetical protein